jgi:ABC-type hemin transport system substrate-binding protein
MENINTRIKKLAKAVKQIENAGEVAKRINKAITKAKKDRVVGMSAMNLYMVTDTKGLTMSVRAYRQAFRDAILTIDRKGFELLSTELDFSLYG